MNAPGTDIERLFQSAIQHHKAGRLQEAEVLYNKILAVEPNNVYATNLLGVIAKQAGRHETAIRLFRQAIKFKPDFGEAYNNLGNTFIKLKNLDKAAANFRKALEINPNQAVIHNNLGNVLNDQGHPDEAAACFRKALTLQPNYANAYNNLGKLLKVQGDLDQAAACYRQALAINPNLFKTHSNLGNLFNEQGFQAEAVACYRKALALKPDYAKAYNNLGRVLKDQGNLEEAVDCFRKALAITPDLTGAHSNLLFTLNYLPNCSQAEIFKESVKWREQHATGLQEDGLVYRNTREKERRLRIGYISLDFRTHSVAYFFEPVVKAHNRERVEVYCYANVVRPDEVTGRLQAAADHWVSIVGKNDAEVAEQIRRDKIDILIDLTGHTGGNSLLVFARKPAPVQVTWLGYPNTTGLQTIDYRLTDGIADPVGEADNLHSEKLVRLENGFLCFQADEAAPAVGALPCRELGYITFGNFNDLAKTTPEVVKLWSEILRLLPGSRLLMKAKPLADEAIKARYLAMFNEEGISSDRIALHGRLPKKEDHLGLYSRVDIGLDPFPYNGTTTTCEALWMGVPVVTMRGDRHAGRVGASIMHQAGLKELVAESSAEYVQLAQTLANDRGRLQEIRYGLRAKMRKSVLMDSRLFVGNIEDAFQRIWHEWCDKGG